MRPSGRNLHEHRTVCPSVPVLPPSLPSKDTQVEEHLCGHHPPGDVLHRLPLLHDDEVSERESQEEVSYLLAAVLGLSSALWVYFGYTVDETHATETGMQRLLLLRKYFSKQWDYS